MKTKEELAELKRKYEALNEKMKELTEEELKEVAGGSGGQPSITIRPYLLTGHVGMYNAVPGQSYYIVIDDSGFMIPYFGHGKLIRTYEEPDSFLFWDYTHRVHELSIDFQNNDKFSNYGKVTSEGYRKYRGSDVTLYTTATWIG